MKHKHWFEVTLTTDNKEYPGPESVEVIRRKIAQQLSSWGDGLIVSWEQTEETDNWEQKKEG